MAPAAAADSDIAIVPHHEITGTLSGTIANTSQEMACFFDSQNLQILTSATLTNEFKILELRSKGIQFRCVTEITQGNMLQCKELMKNFELFHSSCLAGSFLISDKREYLGYLVDKNGVTKMLHVTNPSFVDSQVFLMGTIIDKALPAKQRMVEIAKGIGNEFIETIRDPFRAKSLMMELIDSAVYEIAILFSTRNSFIMAEKEGLLDQLGLASRRGTKVKLLVMKDETVKAISESKLRTPYEDVQVNYLQQFLPTKITTMIIDQSRSLTVEVNDDTKDTMREALGISTYSNSESTVFSNASIFESLWIQSELDKQNSARQAYFQLFKGVKLKNEIYDRRWGSLRKDDNMAANKGDTQT